MKVLSFQPSPRRGGPAIQHLNFMKESAKQGMEHHVVLTDNHEMVDEFESVCASVSDYGKVTGIVPRSLSPSKWKEYFRTIQQLKLSVSQQIKELDIDIVWILNDAYIGPSLAARECGIPSVSHFFGMTSYKPMPVGKVLTMFHKKYSTALITCQDLIADDLVALGYPRDNIEVVYNGILTETFATNSQSEQQSKSNQTIGVVANLDRRKGILEFIEAAALVKDEYAAAKFEIVGDLNGDDAYLAELKSARSQLGLEESLIFKGRVSDMPSWYQSIDVCCVPSQIEALSVACLEAMACGLPIVATDVGGNPIAVKDGVNGLLAKPRDASDLANKLQLMLADADLRSQYGEAGQRIANEVFSIKQVVRDLNLVFNKYGRD